MKVLRSFYVLLRLCNTLLRLLKYVMEPKGFILYPNRGIARALSDYGHK